MLDTFWYLGTPYTKYPGGIEAAFILAAKQAALLLQAGVKVFSPITHTHPIAIHGNIDPLDLNIWLPADAKFMDLAQGIILLRAETWEKSYGMKHEFNVFKAVNKPIVWMDVDTVPDLSSGSLNEEWPE
jgi:hypothetical protein